MQKFCVQPKNFSQFWRINSKIYGFRPYVLKKLQFFLYFLIKIILFTQKIYFLQRKMSKVS